MSDTAGLCACGCGQRTNVAPQTYARLGVRKGEHYRFLSGHNSRVNPTKPGPMRVHTCEHCGEEVKALRRHAPPGAGWCVRTMPHEAAAERFWQKVDKSGECWLWRGSARQGYGQINFRGIPMPAHRFAYELLVGPIPDGLVIDHLCRNPPCVNPAHMEPVTNEENLRRGERRNQFSDVTHCAKGHAYDVANTWHGRNGRQCRTCNRERARQRRNIQQGTVNV